jgi:DNA-binding PadR family transcriptional regulator
MGKENKTAYIILGLLQHEDLSGYDMKKRIDNMISHFWDVGYGQIYPTLKSLEDEGKIVKKEIENNKGPERTIYSITTLGRNALIEWLKISKVKETVKYEILLKLYFGSMLSVEENIDRIDEFHSNQIKNVEMIKLFKKNLEPILKEDEDHLYYYLTVLFGEKIYNAYIEWSKEAMDLLNNYK